MSEKRLLKLDSHSLVIITGLFIVITTTYCIFYPGFSGIFMMDDEPNLSALNVGGGVVSVTNLLQFVFSNDSGSLGRPLSMLSFLIEDQHWPGDPSLYKKNNLYIHLLSGLVIFLVSRLLLNFSQIKKTSNYLALGVTFIWLVNPLHVSTVLYVIQRMTLLMSFFSLLGVLFYLLGRGALTKNTLKAYLYFFLGGVCVLLAVSSKENGILVFAYVAVIECILLRELPRTGLFSYLYKLMVLGPLVLLGCYFVYKWEWVLNGYAFRDFSFYERLLTESRILTDYLYRIIVPQPGGGGLIHDDVVVSRGLLAPITTVISLVFNFGLIVLGCWVRKKHKMLAFAIFWFYVGHLLESTFIPLELYFEHRNYLPMYGPLLALVYYAAVLFDKLAVSGRLLLGLVGVIMLTASSLITLQSATIFGEPSIMFRVWANEHPNSPRAQRIYGQLLGVEGEHEKAIGQLIKTHQAFPKDSGVLIDAMNIACINGMSPPFSISFLQERIAVSKYTDGLTYYVERMFNSVTESKCKYISAEVLIAIIDQLVLRPRMSGESSAKLLLLKARLYIDRKNLNGAMQTLDEAYGYYPMPVLALLQSKLLLSAGLAYESFQFLIKADNVARKHPLKNIAVRAEIEVLKIKFNELGIGNNLK